VNRAQEVVLILAIGVIAIMVLIPPWNATRPKGDVSNVRPFETGPSVYHSIFLEPPKIWRSGIEYIPEINKRLLATQCGIAVILAAAMMYFLRTQREPDEWPPRKSRNQPWNAGK
jgi:hypothetical protein